MARKEKRVYFDYASAPPVLPEATAAAMRESKEFIGNPGAIHMEGVKAKKNLDSSRARIAAIIGCKARELVFTSGLTESNNLAIMGFARALERIRRSLEGTHWMVTSIEHDSVLGCFSDIERLGGDITYIEPDKRGLISPDTVARALRAETVFVSVGWANNETGTIQPLAKVARLVREHEKKHLRQIIFHSDAGQAPLYEKSVVHSLGVDLLALGSNKLYGPHGIGALYISNRSRLAPVIIGGKQERGLRAGTESVGLAAGFATAFEIIAGERKSESKRLAALRNELARELVARIPGLVINSDLAHTLPHMLNVSIPDIQSEYLVLALDQRGVAVSTKSACREGEESESHVIAALGVPRWRSQNTLRFSLGRETSKADVRKALEKLTEVLKSRIVRQG